ncbi:hypothetical protein ABZW03_23235 [Kitasatospora sp. NPDC004799]|uniref:hypothetical protein n=1 Tax=Kitasatospora sp. NPDC004799 TaxID=3154460 RepID=UPI0033A4F6C0
MSDGGDGGYRALIGESAALVRVAHTALRGATAVLTDPAGGEAGVPAAEKALAELLTRIEEDAAGAPGGPAGVVAAVHVGCQVEALAGLAQRLLEAAWARQEREPFAEPLRAPLHGLADAALEAVARAADALGSGAPEDAADVLAHQQDVGERQRLLYDLLLGPERTDPVDATDLVLVSCCYQQCADRAAAVARHASQFSRPGA